jgi:hypothetical protein
MIVMRVQQGIRRANRPTSMARGFRHYLRTIFDYDRKVIKLAPLFFLNRMGKDHVTALLDAHREESGR